VPFLTSLIKSNSERKTSRCLKILNMIRTTQITQEINKKSKINNQETTKKVIHAFLEIIQQKLIESESINFKGYFSIKRSVAKTKGSKNCDEHHKELDKFKQANKGKGITAYTKSDTFR